MMSIAQESSPRTNLSSAPAHPSDLDLHPGPLEEKVENDSCSDGEEIEDLDDVEEIEAVDDLEAEDEDEVDEDDDNIQTVVGVSISRAQTILKSPQTPAAEKARAFDREFGDFPFNGPDDLSPQSSSISSSLPAEDGIIPKSSKSSGSTSLPNSTESQKHQHVDGASASRHGSEARNRLRATTGPDRGSRKLGPFSIPRQFDTSRLSISSLGSWLTSSDDAHTSPGKSKRNSFGIFGFANSRTPNEEINSQESNASANFWTGETTSSMTTEPNEIPPEPRLLRRTTSDTSLFLRQTLSHASSLGDDTRWKNVHEQVNSRFKAIRDSLQDSSLKLPRLPNLSTFSIASTGRSRSPDPIMQPVVSSRPRDLSITSNSTLNPLNATHSARKPSQVPESSAPVLLHPKHPHLNKALQNLEGDVVVMGGYRGSILRSAEAPNRQLWVPIKVGLNIRKVNLEVGLEPSADERMTDNIIPSGMLQHIGPVDISRRLFKHLRSSPNARAGKLRVWDYGYDWRLNPKFLSQQLIEFLENLASNSPNSLPHQRGATVIAHSLGGLVTRHAVNQRPELFNGVLYAGTPQTCVNILGPLRNGDDVLLSSKVLTAQVNFTIRTSFALLPLDGKCFFNPETKEEFPVDFFNPQSYEEYCLSPCIMRPIPEPTDTGGMVGNFVHSMASVLPNITIPRRGSLTGKKSSTRETTITAPCLTTPPETPQKSSIIEPVQELKRDKMPNQLRPTMSYKMEMPAATNNDEQNSEYTAATHVTIAKADAMSYLTRILADVKQFKEELAYNPSHGESGLYPPTTVIYGKSIPTVYGARVPSREAIKLSGAFDDLAFASGDGVVLARASQLPVGYSLAKGGCVSSHRGHVSLLGDLEAVGKCLCAIQREKMRRVNQQLDEADIITSGDVARDSNVE